MINIRGINLKNSVTELTIQEYEKITIALNKDVDDVEKYLDVIVICGMVDEEILTKITFSELFEFIKSLANEDEGVLKGTLINEIEVANRVYRCDVNTIDDILAQDTSLLIKAMKKNNVKYILEMMAILFKDVELTRKEHYAPAHIKHKMAMFADLPAYYALPYISLMIELIDNKIDRSKNKEVMDRIQEQYDQIKNTTDLE